MTGALNADEFRVRGDNRLNIDVKLTGNTDLTYGARDLSDQVNGPPYSLLGNVTSAFPHAEIDPALSALAGKPVYQAGVPARADKAGSISAWGKALVTLPSRE